MLDLSLVQKISIWVVPVLLGITVHEVAHGFIARKLGDNTAFMLGRLTLNPLKHVDPCGDDSDPRACCCCCRPVLYSVMPSRYPINWKNLRQPKRDMALVAAAGPVANLLMAVGWALLLRLGVLLGESGIALVLHGCGGYFHQYVLMILNLLPLPPLDGGRVLTGLLPGPMAYKFSRIEPYGFFILIGLLVTGVLGAILWPLISVFMSMMIPVTGLSAQKFQLLLLALMGR